MEDRPVSVIPSTALWSENYAFMLTDSARGLAAFCLIGRWIGNPAIWREFLMVKLPDGAILHHKAWGKATTADSVGAALARVDILPQPHRFRLLFEGPIAAATEADLRRRGVINQSLTPCCIDIALSSEVPVWDMSGDAHSAEDIAGKMHIEQIGSASGTIAVGEEIYAIRDAFLQRDHSRGVRDVSKFHRHCWAQGRFLERDLTFNIYSMVLFGRETEPMRNASISQGGRRYPAEIIEIGYMDGREDIRRPYMVKLRSELGDMRFQLVDFVASFPTAFVSPWDISAGVFPDEHCVTGLEEAVVWEWEGLRGDGWSERSFNDRPFPAPERMP